MFGITDLTTFIIGTTFHCVISRTKFPLCNVHCLTLWHSRGYQGAFGVYFGDFILILFTALGAASLLHAFPWLFILLKIIGALYLSYLGISYLKQLMQLGDAIVVIRSS